MSLLCRAEALKVKEILLTQSIVTNHTVKVLKKNKNLAQKQAAAVETTAEKLSSIV